MARAILHTKHNLPLNDENIIHELVVGMFERKPVSVTVILIITMILEMLFATSMHQFFHSRSKVFDSYDR